MSRKVRFELNRAGVRELMQSTEMQSVLKDHAAKIRGRLGDGYATNTMVGKNRANTMIFAETAEARKENMEHNTLLKAVQK